MSSKNNLYIHCFYHTMLTMNFHCYLSNKQRMYYGSFFLQDTRPNNCFLMSVLFIFFEMINILLIQCKHHAHWYFSSRSIIYFQYLQIGFLQQYHERYDHLCHRYLYHIYILLTIQRLLCACLLLPE